MIIEESLEEREERDKKAAKEAEYMYGLLSKELKERDCYNTIEKWFQTTYGFPPPFSLKEEKGFPSLSFF